MGNLKRNYRNFILRHRNKGIPNLMLWIVLGNALVFMLEYYFKVPLLNYLNFDAAAIMRGQVWRLFSYIFTFACESSFLGSRVLGALITLMFYHWIGKFIEMVWGPLRFNLYYLCGILLIDLYAMLLYWIFGPVIFLSQMVIGSTYLNLSLFLAVATLSPDQIVRILMILPMKMKWLAWVDFILTAHSVVLGIMDCIAMWTAYGSFWGLGCLMVALFPLVALLNYVLFFGKDIINVMPDWIKRRASKPRRSAAQQPRPDPNWAEKYRNQNGERPYRHKCTVCGRTDTSCPGLEFRYCSRCKGYFCYCIDHINNHNHVQ